MVAGVRVVGGGWAPGTPWLLAAATSLGAVELWRVHPAGNAVHVTDVVLDAGAHAVQGAAGHVCAAWSGQLLAVGQGNRVALWSLHEMLSL